MADSSLDDFFAKKDKSKKKSKSSKLTPDDIMSKTDESVKKEKKSKKDKAKSQTAKSTTESTAVGAVNPAEVYLYIHSFFGLCGLVVKSADSKSTGLVPLTVSPIRGYPPGCFTLSFCPRMDLINISKNLFHEYQNLFAHSHKTNINVLNPTTTHTLRVKHDVWLLNTSILTSLGFLDLKIKCDD